jgi:hypothetical protein
VGEGGFSGGGFGEFFAGAGAFGEGETVPCDAGDEGLAVVWSSFREDGVGGAAEGDGLEGFLELALWVDLAWLGGEGAEFFAAEAEDGGADGVHAGVEIDGSDEGFEGVGERAGAFAATAGCFAAAHDEVFAEIEAEGCGGEGWAGDDASAEFGEGAFVEIGEGGIEEVGEDELEDGVAEEFEALVAELVAMGLVGDARVRERLFEEGWRGERVAERCFQRVHG